MDIREIRYKNARSLINEEGGLTEFGKKIGKAQSQVSSFAGSNPSKGIGNQIARQIEKAFNKPSGWMDKSHSEDARFELLNYEIRDFSTSELAEILEQAKIISRRKRGEL